MDTPFPQKNYARKPGKASLLLNYLSLIPNLNAKRNGNISDLLCCGASALSCGLFYRSFIFGNIFKR
jgi:hypothetical protein